MRQPIFVKVLFVVGLLIAGLALKTALGNSTSKKIEYQTAIAEKGVLIVAVSGSGQVTTANSAPVYTQSSGVVSQLFVKEGDIVSAGDKIAEIDLDLSGRLTSSQALSSYQNAQNNLKNAQATLYSLQSSMFTSWDTFRNLTQDGKYTNGDGSANKDNRTLPEFIVGENNWLAAEAKYKNQQGVVSQAQTALNTAWLSYQLASPTVYAPISGKVTGLSLQVGSVISASSSQSTTTQTNNKIASIRTDASPTVTVNLTEIDVTKVKEGNKVTVTLDAFSGKTFTGKVISIDTTGVTSSGVTSYPAVVQLDSNEPNMLANMSAQANIITRVKEDVLKIPSSAVRTANGLATVQIMEKGKPVTVTVTIGDISDTESEVTSGLKVGDKVVTNTVSSTAAGTSRTTSVFSTFGGGSGAMRIAR